MRAATSHKQKMKLSFIIILTGLYCALLSCTDDTPKINKLSKDATILAFGDSLTYGTGVEAAESYPAQLQLITGRKVIRDGRPGELTAEGLERFPESLSKYNPDLVLLCLGGNDFLRQKKQHEIYSNLKAIIRIAKKRKVTVVLIGVPYFSISSMLGTTPAPLYRRL